MLIVCICNIFQTHCQMLYQQRNKTLTNQTLLVNLQVKGKSSADFCQKRSNVIMILSFSSDFCLFLSANVNVQALFPWPNTTASFHFNCNHVLIVDNMNQSTKAFEAVTFLRKVPLSYLFLVFQEPIKVWESDQFLLFPFH